MTNSLEPTTQTLTKGRNNQNIDRIRYYKLGGVGLVFGLGCYYVVSGSDMAPVALPLLLIVGAVWYKVFDKLDKNPGHSALQPAAKPPAKGSRRGAIWGAVLVLISIVTIIAIGNEASTPTMTQSAETSVMLPTAALPDMAALRRDNPREYLNRVRAVEGEARWREELKSLFPHEYEPEVARSQEEQREKLRAGYTDELASTVEYLKNYSFSIFEKNPNGYIVVIEEFDMYAKLYERGATLDLKPEQLELREKLRKKLIEIQVSAFPKLRDYMAEALNQKLWEDDIKVFATGNRNRSLMVEGWKVSTNRNKREIYLNILEDLSRLRFDSNYYRAFRGADSEGWTLDNIPNDRDLAYWQSGRFVMVSKSDSPKNPR